MWNDPGERFPIIKRDIHTDEANEYVYSADELFPQIMKNFTQRGPMRENRTNMIQMICHGFSFTKK